MTDLSAYRRLLDDRKADARLAVRELKEAEQAAQEAAQRLRDSLDALDAAAAVAAALQEQAHAGVAAVVSRCLSSVLDDPYEFRLAFERANGRTRCRCVFLQGGEEVDPAGAAPGGAVDLAAFALRLACLVLSEPKPRRLLCLDEPLRHLHGKAYRARAAQLLLTLADELGVQIVMATGMREYQVGNVIEL